MNANELIQSSELRAGSGDTPCLETLVAKHPFFQGLSPHQLRLLGDCAMLVKYKAGEIIFREGEPANRFYLIHDGKVALESYVQDRSLKRVTTVGAGEELGWSWLFPPYYWHFDARAVEPTEAIFFYATPLREECESDHDLGYEMMKRTAGVMMTRLEAIRRQMLSLNECRGCN